MPKRLAILPAFNESGAVAATVAEIFEHAPEYDVLVVDDGSTDATTDRARTAGARVITLPFNLGIGGAVQTGYQYADDNGYAIAVQVDADGQHDPRHITDLEDVLRGDRELNMVTGSRFLTRGDGFRSSASRRVGIRIFARVLSMVVGQPVTDPTSGFRMVDRKGIELFARDYPRDYPEVEAVLLLHFHRLRSREVPVRMRERLTGVSSINASRSAYYMIKVLLAVFVGLLRTRPVVEPGGPPAVQAEHAL